MLHDTHTMGNDRALNEVCLYIDIPAIGEVISPRNGSSGRSGYDITVIPSFPVISAYGLNLCQAQGQAQVLAAACIENHAESAEIVVI